MKFVATCILALVMTSAMSSALTTSAKKPIHEWSGVKGEKVTGALRASNSNGYAPCDPTVKQYSGYFDIQASTNKHYFFWAFESRGNPYTDPVILWLTGGPGCSSSLAILTENGACHINATSGELYRNPYSWNDAATVIYIDQPAGVGFSYADQAGYDHNETEVAEDMYHFLLAFFHQYPQYSQNKFFVYGESYGGHFAPATAHRVWRGNKDNEGPYIPLTGLSVGNGMVNTKVQMNYYSQLAYDWCITVKGEPCVSHTTYEQMVAAQEPCSQKIDKCVQNNTKANCDAAYQYCLGNLIGPYEATGLNVYDIRIPCEVPGLCYNFTMATRFMNEASVQQALGVPSQTQWNACSYTVNGKFDSDWMHSMADKVPDLLENDIRVLIYGGDMDFICNWLGDKAWTLALDWSMKTQYNAATDTPWYMEFVEAGFYRTVSSNTTNMLFTFLQVHGAGHLVPMDQPARALNMVQHFLADRKFH